MYLDCGPACGQIMLSSFKIIDWRVAGFLARHVGLPEFVALSFCFSTCEDVVQQRQAIDVMREARLVAQRPRALPLAALSGAASSGAAVSGAAWSAACLLHGRRP